MRTWVKGVLWASTYLLHLRFKISGQEHLPKSPFIIASKHQSAWETFILPFLFTDSAIVLKQELLQVPLFGRYLKKIGAIPLARVKNERIKSLKKLLTFAQNAVEDGQRILIFPEGTRSSPEQAGVYHSGVFSLYHHLNIPVVPIALNSGLYWPRRSFLKHPGVITVAVLKPIYPGLSRQDFMRKLQEDIESTTHLLVDRRSPHEYDL